MYCYMALNQYNKSSNASLVKRRGREFVKHYPKSTETAKVLASREREKAIVKEHNLGQEESDIRSADEGSCLGKVQ